MMAARAKRNTMRLEASFTRLSPSRMVTTRLGMRRPPSTEVAATASGGEMMPPSRKPIARVNPGIIACATTATAAEVKITRPKASSAMARRWPQKSRQEVNQAAS